MPTIFQRLEDIFTANSHAALDQIENPARMSQQLLRELDEDLNKLRGQLVAALARQRQLEQAQEKQQNKLSRCIDQARKAVVAEDEILARKKLGHKIRAEQELEQIQILRQQQNELVTALRQEREQLLQEREELGGQMRLIQIRNEFDPARHGKTNIYSRSMQRRERMAGYAQSEHLEINEIIAGQSLRSEELDQCQEQTTDTIEAELTQLKAAIQQENGA